MSSNLNQRAARSGIIEQCNTCLIVFLHNTSDPMERVFARVSAYSMYVTFCDKKWYFLLRQQSVCYLEKQHSAYITKHVSKTSQIPANSNSETIH